MVKRHLRFIGHHPRQTPTIGQFVVWLVTTFFTVTAAVEVAKNFYYDGGISRRGYTLIVIAVVAAGLVYFQRRFGRGSTGLVPADVPLDQPVPQTQGQRIGIKSRRSSITGGRIDISNQDIGVDQEDTEIDSIDLRIK